MKTEKINLFFSKVKSVYNKLRYVIEFLLAIILCAFLYKFVTVKAYEGYWSRLYLILLGLTGIIFLANFVWNLKKDKDKIENMFLNFAIPIGMLFITFMLPSYTPDASSHIWKSYELSNGIVLTKIDENGESKSDVPYVLAKYRETTLTKYSLYNQLFSLEEAYDYNNTVKEDVPSKGYSSIFFVGYALGFFIARILALNIYIGVILARLINFAIILVCGYIAIKKIPFGKILLTAYLLIPMMMQQATAISVDSIMNAIIILYISYTLNLVFKKDELTKKEKIIYLVFSVFIGVSKVTYIPILGMGLILAKRRKEMNIKTKTIIGVLSVLICIISWFTLTKLTSGYENESAKKYLETTGVNSSEQLSLALHNPLHFIKTILIYNFRVNGDFYILSSIGQNMGWLSINAPITYSIMYILLLFASIYVEKNEVALDIIEKGLMIVLSLGMALLVVIGLYLQWTEVGAEFVAGVQGRYFLPIGIMFLLALCKKDNYVKITNPNIVIPMWALIINLLFIKNVMAFFI